MAAPLSVERLEDRTVPSTFTVGNLADNGPGSLRQAIDDANANPGADVIRFASPVGGTLTLTSGQLSITDDLILDGPGTHRLTISGNDASRVFSVSGGATDVEIRDLTIANGRATDAAVVGPIGPVTLGGGLLNTGAHVSLSHVTMDNNQAVGPIAQGGAIANFSGATLVMDTTNHLFTPVFVAGGGFDIPEMTGFPDVVLVPDPATFQVLPWAPGTAWCLSDMYFSNGKPVPFSTRAVMRNQLDRLEAAGFDYIAGLEVEFYILQRESPVNRIDPTQTGWPPPPFDVKVSEQGYLYLSETRLAGVNVILTILRDNLEAIGLPIRTMEDEWGPGQMEFTFDALPGLGSADAMVLFRTAVKQICQMNGYHATFMCRPNLPNFFSSGWHLHESLRAAGGDENAFTDPENVLSPVGNQFLAGCWSMRCR